MKWVHICGAHSVGKTTLCDYLMKNIQIEGESPQLISEVARSIIKERNITNVSTSNVPQFHKLNLDILEEQAKRMKAMQKVVHKGGESINSSDDSVLCLTDRGPLDPISYLQLFVGEAEACQAMQLRHVSEMIDGLADPNSTLMIVIKPQEQFVKCDNVRIVPNFKELLEYTKIMIEMLENLNVKYVFVKEANLRARAILVADGIRQFWPNLDVTLNS